MASRSFQQFTKSLNHELVLLEANATVDSTQTAITDSNKVKSVKGSGIKNIKNVGTGTYRITFQDAYARYLSGTASVIATPDTPVAIASLSNGVSYSITTVGTSAVADWTLAGLDTDITPAVGIAFTAVTAASGSTGTGYAAPASLVQPAVISVLGNPSLTIAKKVNPYIIVQLYKPTNSSTTTLVLADPPDGSIIVFTFMLRNSSVKGKGE